MLNDKRQDRINFLMGSTDDVIAQIRETLPDLDERLARHETLATSGHELSSDIIHDAFIDPKDIHKFIQADRIDEVSDGYHTFNELYDHRAKLFSVICELYKDNAWKSKFHEDGTMYPGMFIVGIMTPEGPATYHYNIEYWPLFNIRTLKHSIDWDGHTSDEAISRILSLKNLAVCKRIYMTDPTPK